MSVIEKIKNVVETMEDCISEKPIITLTSYTKLVVENYKFIKLFCDNRLYIIMEDFGLCVEGDSLIIESFSPIKITVEGRIFCVKYIFSENFKEEI